MTDSLWTIRRIPFRCQVRLCSGAFGHDGDVDALDWDPDIYGIRALDSCRARQTDALFARVIRAIATLIGEAGLMGSCGGAPQRTAPRRP
jgi:hypothetical protein